MAQVESMASSSGSPQSVKNDAERIGEITTFIDNGLQELQQPLLCQDEGDNSVEHNEESCYVENPKSRIASSVKEKLKKLPNLCGEYCCIYRVPGKISEKQEAAFTPKVVSIGPLHHGKENLQVMEEHKQRYLKEFLSRQTNVSVEDFIAIVMENEVQLRNCYAETIGMGPDEFVEMNLVDATFIIELLLKDREHSSQEFINDRIFNKPWMLHDVMVDMLMLENQIPYFILEKLYSAARMNLSLIEEDEVDEERGQLSIIALFYHCFKQFLPGEYNLDQLFCSKILHFLDFFRIAFQPNQKPEKAKISRKRRTITELEQVGVKFQALNLATNSMLDIKFHDGILQIPNITCKGGTDVLLRNLVAFEQCHCNTNVLTDYATFLDSLIDTNQDIEILIRNDVLEDWSGDNTRALNMFNNVSASCSFEKDDFFYAKVWKDVDDYCKLPWHKWKAILQRNYLNTPWAIISLMAGAILLILTALQTVWSMTHP